MNDTTAGTKSTTERYTRRLPLALIENVPKDTQALRVFCVIEAHRNKATGVSNPSIPTIAKHCGVTTRAVVRAVAKLMEARIYDPSSQQRGKNTHYQLGATALAVLTKDGNVLGAEPTEDAHDTNRGRLRSKTKDGSVLQTEHGTDIEQHGAAFNEKERTISALVAIGIDRAQATMYVSEDPSLAVAWLNADWSDYPGVEDRAGFVCSRLQRGIEPDKPRVQRPRLGSLDHIRPPMRDLSMVTD